MAAPNLKEIEWAIQELEQKESSFPVYAKLANLYTVRNEMIASRSRPEVSAHSNATGPSTDPSNVIGVYGDTEFLNSIVGKEQALVWPIIDDLMNALQVVNHRAYSNVLQKLKMI